MLDHPGPSLTQAAPFIAQFRDQTVVIKIGGELFGSGAVADLILPQIEVLYLCGLHPVVVHGGGKQIDLRCGAAGVPIVKRAGRRITSPEVLQIMLDVVAGELNSGLCDGLRARGIRAAGFAEGLSQAVRCRRRAPVDVEGESIDFGDVGDIEQIDVPRLFTAGSADGYVIPVLPSVGWLADGRWLNVNADSVASHVALALRAQKLIMLSREPGVMRQLTDAGPIATLSSARARALVENGLVVGGMRAKIEEALRALAGGIPQVQIISGAAPQTLLLEVFTEEGCGTLISA